MEVINESLKLIAQAVDVLKAELRDDLPSTWNHEGNIDYAIILLEQSLEKLTNKM